MNRPPSYGAWSLLVIDSEPIRRKMRRDYEKVRREIDKTKAEIERFQVEDQPSYSRWLNSNFGVLLSETRELQHKVHDLEHIVAEVEQEFFYGRHRSMAAAYRKVMRRRIHPEEFEQERKAEEERAEELRRRFEEFFGLGEDFLDEEDEQAVEDFTEQRGGRSYQTNAHPHGSDLRLKDLYRRLARKLHPDTGGKRSAQQIELWHQTQAAYETGNVEQLEAILSLAEVEENGTAEASVSLLQQITAKVKEGLKALRRELRQYKKDAAWNFSRLVNREALGQRTREILELQRLNLAMLLQRLEAQIHQWQSAAERSPVAGRRRRDRVSGVGL